MGYYELPENDRPPEEIWLDSEALAGHFEAVRARYRDKTNGGWEDVKDVPPLRENRDDEIRRIKGD